MVESFFRRMRFVEEVLSGKRVLLDDDDLPLMQDEQSRKTFQRVINLVESGCVAKSEKSRFICQNWRLNVKQLQDRWQKQTGKLKTAGAFRAQIAALSNRLYNMLGDEFDIEIIVNNVNALNERLDMAELSDLSFDDVFPLDSESYIIKRDCRYYTIEQINNEFGYELGVLKKYRKDIIQKAFSKADTQKIGYIKRVIEGPYDAAEIKENILKKLGYIGND